MVARQGSTSTFASPRGHKIPWRISFPKDTRLSSMPASLKEMSVSLTYPRSVDASGPRLVGQAAGGGCFWGSAQ